MCDSTFFIFSLPASIWSKNRSCKDDPAILISAIDHFVPADDRDERVVLTLRDGSHLLYIVRFRQFIGATPI